ncbi:MAG: tetratricopeptide repeat protein [Nitrospirae bacterium]|nr:tetratricopeptide repeat protein [Nitrospirota bacterium]
MKKIFYLVFLVLFAVACQQKEEPKPQYQFPTGPIQGHDEVKLLQEATKKDPKNVDAWIKLGNTFMDTSRFNEAIESYQKALELDPKNVDVRVDMGTCYRGLGKPDLAVKEYRRALEINPNHLNAHKNLGVVLMDDFKDRTQAIKAFEKYLQLAPNAPDSAQVKQVIQSMKTAK